MNDRNLAKKYNLNVDAIPLLRLLPNYDPFHQAEDCYFDTDAGWDVIKYFKTDLKFAKGAKAGQPFILEPWQQCIAANFFGWKKKKTGLRRYKECFLYVPKKNGKGAFTAGLILYVLDKDNEGGAEIYSAASTRDQAALIFGHASVMVKKNPRLNQKLRVYGDKGGTQRRRIVKHSDMSFYDCLSADVGANDGLDVHMLVADEVHRHDDPALVDILVKGTAARSQPIIFYTTTADYNRPSACNSLLERAKLICNNKGDKKELGYNPTFLPAVWESKKDVDYTDPKVWKAVNPNLGVTIPMDYLEDRLKEVEETPSKLNSFQRLHLNIVTDAEEAWLDSAKWKACQQEPIDEEDLLGERCYAGIDLSSTDDLTALVLFFPEHKYILPFFWIPKDNARKRSKEHHVPYIYWEQSGHMYFTPGYYIDHKHVLKKMLDVSEKYDVPEVCIDPAMSRQITADAAEHDIEILKWPQAFGHISEPSKRLETMIKAETIRHPGNPVLTWNIGNVVIERDHHDNIKPSKKLSSEKIDGVIALVMALGRWLEEEDDEPGDIIIV